MKYFGHEMECCLHCFGHNFVSKYRFCWSKLEIMGKPCSWENIMFFQSIFSFQTATCVLVTEIMLSWQSRNKNSIQWIFRQTSLLMMSHIEGKSSHWTWTENTFPRQLHLYLRLQYSLFQIQYQKQIVHINIILCQLTPTHSIACRKAPLTVCCHWQICRTHCPQLQHRVPYLPKSLLEWYF